MTVICRQCHAQVLKPTPIEPEQLGVCPACGGVLVNQQALETVAENEADAFPETDHRGIILPRRHAVGGVITPR